MKVLPYYTTITYHTNTTTQNSRSSSSLLHLKESLTAYKRFRQNPAGGSTRSTKATYLLTYPRTYTIHTHLHTTYILMHSLFVPPPHMRQLGFHPWTKNNPSLKIAVIPGHLSWCAKAEGRALMNQAWWGCEGKQQKPVGEELLWLFFFSVDQEKIEIPPKPHRGGRNTVKEHENHGTNQVQKYSFRP